MPWLRIDDKFARHPKVTRLTDREFRVHIRVLCYCAEYGTRGQIPDVVFNEVPGLTRKIAGRFVALGLWDETDGALSVHDFEHYNPKDPTGAERKRRERDKSRDIDRDAERDIDRDNGVTVTAPHAQAAARVPSRPQKDIEEANASSSEQSPKKPRKPDALWDTLEREIGPAETKSERGRRNKALAELREVGATPGEMVVRIGRYRRRWPDMAMTDSALAANWSTLSTAGANGSSTFRPESEDEREQRIVRDLAARGPRP